MPVTDPVAFAVHDRLLTLLGLFTDDEIEAGIRRLDQPNQDRLSTTAHRATMRSKPVSADDEDATYLIDHSECTEVGVFSGNVRSHRHEGVTGLWLFPSDFKPDGTPKGLYDESPTGAGF